MNSPGIRNGILSGEAASREYIAYAIDQYNFHGVPPTTLVEINHPFF